MLHNGRVARAAVTGMARLVSAELADWVAGNVAFPNGENLEKKMLIKNKLILIIFFSMHSLNIKIKKLTKF
jgi:hypothetical protein